MPLDGTAFYTEQDIPENITLGSLYDLEVLIEAVAVLESRVEHYKGLKAHRIKVIDAAIDHVSNKIDQLRSVMLEAMRTLAPNQKTVDFPGIGRVTRKKSPRRWEVTDEPGLLSYLEDIGRKGEVEEVKIHIKKSAINSVLEDLSSSTQPKDIPGVVLHDGEEQVSIKLDNKTKAKPVQDDDDDVPPKAKPAKSKPSKVADKVETVSLEEF